MGCKKKRGMADGGIVLADSGQKETPEQMLARMNAKYGLGDSGKQQSPQPSPAPTPQPAPAPQSQSGLMGRAMDSVGRRNDELRAVSRYARGGVMPVMGIGSGTSDSIPVVVAGKKVHLSNGEGVAVLPKKTMQTPGATDAVEQIIEGTNGKPVATRVQDGDGYVKGVVQDGSSFTQTDQGPADMTDPNKYPYTGQPQQNIYRDVSASGLADAILPSPTASPSSPQTSSGYGGVLGDAPSAQVVQRNVTGYGLADSGSGSSVAGVKRDGNSFSQIGSGPSAAPAANARPWWAGTDTRDTSTGLEQEQARTAAKMGLSDTIRALNGPSMLTTALVGDGKKQVSPVADSAPYGNDGNQAGLQSVNSQVQTAAAAPDPSIATATGNAGDAKFNPDAGTLSFTSKGFDPTKQQFAPGTGAVTDPKTGRTIMITGSPSTPASGAAQAASGVMGGGLDAYGNSTAITQQAQGQLDQIAKSNAAEDLSNQKWRDSQQSDAQAYRERERAESAARNIGWAANDVASGSGAVTDSRGRTRSAPGTDGKVAALNAMQQADSAARNSYAQQVAQRNGAAAEQGRQAGYLAGISAQGNNQLANTALAGQNQLAVENVRQSSPDNALRSAKLTGEVADYATQQAVRNGLLAAIDSGDKAKIDQATRKAVAAGVIKNEKPTNEYVTTPSPLGGFIRTNKETGDVVQVGVDGKASSVQMPGQAAAGQQFSSEADAMAAKKAGKIKPGEQIIIAGRPVLVN